MAEFDKNDVKAVLNKSKAGGTPVHYAFGLAGKPEECAFVVHKTQNGKKLMAQLKSDKALKKIGYGTVTYDGRIMEISEERPAKGIARMLIKLFKTNGLAVKPVLAGEDADADGDSADATAAGEGGDAAPVDLKVKEQALNEIIGIDTDLDDLLAEVERELEKV